MIAVHTPHHRSGAAFGALSAAVFSGSLCGNTIGGFVADWLGYRNAFYIGAGLMVISVLFITVGVRDVFEAPSRRVRHPRRRLKLGFLTVLPALPLLALVAFITLCRLSGMSLMPLLVQELNVAEPWLNALRPPPLGDSTVTGLLGGCAGIAGFASGLIMGRLADRISAPKIAVTCALLAAIMMLPQALAWSLVPLFIGRFLAVFFAGGLDPVFQIWLAKSTAVKRRGFVFGWAASAKSVGWMMAPLLGGAVASLASVRWVFGVGCLLYLLLVPAIIITVRKLRAAEPA